MEDSGPEAENANAQDYPADEDSDHIEEESTSSHLSGQSSGSAPNWRNWRAPVPFGRQQKDSLWKLDEKQKLSGKSRNSIDSLVDISSRFIGRHFPFEAAEKFVSRIPDNLQLKIAFYSFPDDEASIRLYSCLANGSVEEFTKGELLYKSNVAINDVVQIGFYLSATITVSLNHPPTNETLTTFRTSVMFDRRKITACSCSCTEQKRNICSCGASRPRKQMVANSDLLNAPAIACVCGEGKRTRSSQTWCSHVVALCLFRINEPDRVQLRTPVSETLGKLERNQLQKFAQFLISKLPVQNLTVAQQILDELLSNVPNDINMACGAPDPTAGGCLSEYAGWLLDDKAVEDKLAIAISEFVKPAPQIYSDITTLSAESSSIATEYISLLRPLRGHDPEGVWNLLHIVRHMFRRQDTNAILLLQIVTRKILDAGKILLWWFQTKILVGEDHGGMRFGGGGARVCNRNGAQCNNFSQAHHLHYHHQFGVGGNSNGNAENAVFQRYAASSLCDEMVALWRIGALSPAIGDDTRAMLCLELLAMHKVVFDCVHKQCISGGGQGNNGAAANSNAGNHIAEWCSSEEGLSLFTRFRPAIEACLVPWDSIKQKNSLFRVSNVSFCPYYARQAVESNAHHTTKSPLAVVQTEFASGLPCTIHPPITDSIEELFARAEALYAHGYSAMACELARDLCLRILQNPPVLVEAKAPVSSSEKSSSESTGRSTPFRSEYLQCVAIGQMLSRAQFLLNVLSTDQFCWSLAFRVGIFAIDIPRPPCFSKYLEVKLVHQEREVIDSIRRLPPLGPDELAIVRQKALQMCSGYYASTGLRPPITLGAYIFEVLCTSSSLEDDRDIGFQAAVEAVGFKLPVCEVDHPMLYESFRHQKGELAVQLLLFYKDEVPKLERVLNKLLDRQPESCSVKSSATTISGEPVSTSGTQPTGDVAAGPASSSAGAVAGSSSETQRRQSFRRVMSLPVTDAEAVGVGAARDAEDSSALEDEQEDRAIAARLRCVLTVRPNQQPNHQQQLAPPGGAVRFGNRPSGPDSSAPETTSSDNSPTFGRRAAPWRMPSSLSFGSDVSSQQQQIRAAMQQARPSNNSRWGQNSKSNNGSGNGNGSASRVLQPTEPNQPSEAAAQFVFELAKQVLQKAGGSTSQTYFHRPVPARPHAALHMCAFQIGLHALALHNAVNVTWLSRVYSAYGSWIIMQAIEIGVPALRLLIEAWEGHLTPSEVARLADQAGRVPDRQVIRSSVELAYRALEYSSCLSVAEVRRALDQCEELSLDKVKTACLAVEQAAVQTGSVPQDVLFATAEKLMDIHQKIRAKSAVNLPSGVHQQSVHPVSVAVQQPSMMPVQPIPGRFAYDQQQQAAMLPPNAHHGVYSVPGNPPVVNPQYGPFGGYAAGPYGATQPFATLVQFPSASSALQPQYHLVPVHITLAPHQYGAAQGVPQLHQMVGPYGPPMPQQPLEQNPFGLAAVMEHHPMQQFGLPSLPPPPPPQMPQPQPGQMFPSQQQQQQPQMQQPAQTMVPASTNLNLQNQNEPNNYFLSAAFRVGMLALEQIRRSQEEKPTSVKVSKAPPPLLGNVKWLFHTAIVIGPDKVDDVCRAVLVALPDGAVLHEMCDQLEEYTAGLIHDGSPVQAPYIVTLQTTWNQMYHKALSNYRGTIQHKTAHLLQAEQEDFMHMLTNAKRLFTKTQNGSKQFAEILTTIRKNKNLRKDWVQKLLKALQMHRNDGGPQAMF